MRVRAAAVIVDGARLLLHRRREDAFWALPGGRVEAGETGPKALQRELLEELDEAVESGELLWVVENFFRGTGDAAPRQELGLCFRVALPAASRLAARTGPFAGMEEHARLVFQWFDRAALERIEIRPRVLAAPLRHLLDGQAPSAAARHLVQRDGADAQ